MKPPATRAYNPLKPAFGAVLTAQNYFDGVVSADFHPCILIVSATAQAFMPDETIQNPAPRVAAAGAITVQVAGILESGGQYYRRFQIPVNRAYRLDIEFLQSLRVDVLGSTLINGVLWGVVTERSSSIQVADVAYFSEEYAAAGRYLTPPGADLVTAVAADGGFAWELSTINATFNLTDALAAGVPVDVKSGLFVTTVANLRLAWRIRL